MFEDKLTAAYLKFRRSVRALVLNIPFLDQNIGKRLVQIDLWLRKRGVMDSVLRRDSYRHEGLQFFFGEQDRGLLSSLIANGSYEPETLEAVTRLGKGDTFIDMGAHIGFFTLHGARCVGPNGHVIAFEPTRATREVLERNVKANNLQGHVKVEPYAISNASGVATFHVFDKSQGNSVMIGDEELGASSLQEVSLISLDEYVEAHGIESVDLVKMDIEGQELNALYGMEAVCEKNPQLTLIFEYHRSQLARAGTDPRELFEQLNRMGLNSFHVLFREPIELELPAELDRLEAIASRANVNILACREGSASRWCSNS